MVEWIVRGGLRQKVGLLGAALLLAPLLSQAALLDSSVIGMFPKNTRDFGYADLSTARELPWFPQVESQMVPVSFFEVEQLLESIQLQKASPVNEVAWADVSPLESYSGGASSDRRGITNAQPVVVAIGNFDAATIQTFLDSKRVPFVQVGDYTLYKAGTGPGINELFFAVLDQQTIVVGGLKPLKHVLRTRDGEEDSLLQDDSMMALIQQENGEGIFWDVLDGASAQRAIAQLVPQAARFSQSSDLMERVKDLLITVSASSDIELHFQAACDSPTNALLISQLLEAGVLMRRYQMKDLNDAELDGLFDALRIGPDGTLVDISLELTDEQVTDLIEHNVFALRM